MMRKVIHKALNTRQTVLLYLKYGEKHYKDVWKVINDLKKLATVTVPWKYHKYKMFTEGRIPCGILQGKALCVEEMTEVGSATRAGCWQAQTDDGLAWWRKQQ